MNHSFNVEVAVKYGIESAVLLENIMFWVEKNKATKSNMIDGQFWVYTTQEAFTELFPYMSKSTVRRSLKTFIDDGVLNVGNFNKKGFDRTRWYTLTPHGYSLFKMNHDKKDNAPCAQNSTSDKQCGTEDNRPESHAQPHVFKSAHPCAQNEPTIPIIKEDIKEEQNKSMSFSKNKNDPHAENFSKTIDQIVKDFNRLETPFPRVMKLTAKRKGLINARIKDVQKFAKDGETNLFGDCKTFEDICQAMRKFFMVAACSEFMAGSNDRGWVADFDHLMSESGFMSVVEGKRHPVGKERENAKEIIAGEAIKFEGEK